MTRPALSRTSFCLIATFGNVRLLCRFICMLVAVFLFSSVGLVSASAQATPAAVVTQIWGESSGSPAGVVVDKYGYTYFVEQGSPYYLKMLPPGCNQTSCLVGLTYFNSPGFGLAIDASGNLFATLSGPTGSVVEISPVNGAPHFSQGATVRTLEGGLIDPQGVAVDGSGNVYVALVGSSYYRLVIKLPAVNGVVPTNSPTIENVVYGLWRNPVGVAADAAGDVFVSDENLNQIIEVPAGCATSSCTIVLGGNAVWHTPNSLAVDPSGNLYVYNAGASSPNPTFQIISPGCTSSSCVTPYPGVNFNVAGNGIFVDQYGNLTFSNIYNNGVGYISQVIPDAGYERIDAPTQVGSTTTQTVQFDFAYNGTPETITGFRVVTQGAPSKDFTTSGSPNCGPLLPYTATSSTQCLVTVNFKPTAIGPRKGAVQALGSGGTVLATAMIQGIGVAPLVTFPYQTTVLPLGSNLYYPQSVAVDASGNVYIADTQNNAVKEIPATNGNVSSATAPVTIGSGFSYPYAVAVDGLGNVYVADMGNGAIKKIVAVNGAVSSSSQVITINNSFISPTGVAVDGAGNVYVANQNGHNVQEIVAVGGAVSPSSSVITIGSGFTTPDAVDVDGSGNVFVSDFGAGSIFEIVAVNGSVSSTSQVLTLASGILYPAGVAVDGGENVYFTAPYSNAVSEIVAVNGAVSSSSPVITLGTPLPNTFSQPHGLAVDNKSHVFVADWGHFLVKEIELENGGLNFTTGTDYIGSLSADSPQAFTLFNSGNAPLTFTLPASGTNPSFSGTGAAAYSLNSSSTATCPLETTNTATGPTLAAGGSCTLPISFTPVAVQNEAFLTIADNSLNQTGSGAVQVMSLYGVGTQGPPVITSVSPATGAAIGGTSVTITGTGLNGATEVFFGNTEVTTFTSVTATSIVLNAPAGTAGSQVNVRVWTPAGGYSAITSADQFTFAAPTATLAVPSTSVVVNLAATPFTPVTGSGGVGTLSYSVSPALPAGLVFSTTTGTVSGTPTSQTVAATYTVTVTDSGGDTATQGFTLAVNGPLTATKVIPVQDLNYGVTFTPFTPVVPSGGASPYSFTTIQPLPAGLTISPTTGAISGTPQVAEEATTYTVKITDATGTSATNGFNLYIFKAPQNITGFAASQTVTYGVSPITLTATPGASGNPVTFTVLSGPGIVNGNILTITGPGLIGLAADEAGSAIYAAAPELQQAVTVLQPLTVTATAITVYAGQPATQTVGQLMASFSGLGLTLPTLEAALQYGELGFTVTGPGFSQNIPLIHYGQYYGANLLAAVPAGAPTGTFTLTPYLTGPSAANFNFTLIAGTLTISNLQQLSVTAANITVHAGQTPTQTVAQLMASYSAPGLTGLQLEAELANAEFGFTVTGPGFSSNIPLISYGTYYGTNLLNEVPVGAPTGTFTMTPYLIGPGAATFSFTETPGTLTIAYP